MPTEAAGRVNVVLSVNQVNFTAAMKDAQNQLDQFAGKSKAAGHASVSSMQATSAAIRAMHGGFENNIRSVERWISQSKIASSVAKTMFPIIGAATFGFMIVDLGVKVAAFVAKANAMPKAIEQGFNSMHLSAESTTDALRLTNDQLQNSINKLQGKAQNNLAIQIDEARIAADKLATSLENDANKVKALLKENNLSGLSSFLGKAPTSSVSGSVNSWNSQLGDLAYQKTQRLHEGNKDGAAALDKQIDTTRQKALAWAADQLKVRDNASTFQGNVYGGKVYQDMAGDQSGNRNILRGFQNVLQDQTDNQSEETRHSTLVPQKANLDAQKAASESAKKAAHDRVQAMQDALDAMKVQQNMSLKSVYDYWEGMKAGETAGGIAYSDIVKKQAQIAVEGATKAHETFAKFQASQLRDDQDAAKTGPGLINGSARFLQGRAAKTSATNDADARDSNQMFMEDAKDSARLQEARITDAAGNSMTRYAAAIAMANVHATELKATLLGLKANIDIAQKNYDDANTPGGDPDKIRQTKQALNAARGTYGNAQTTGQIQSIQDSQSTDPGFSSATTGAADALNEFVNASRNAAGMMSELVTNTLNGLNNQVVTAMTSGKANFKQFGLGVTRNVAGAALQKGEGAVMGALGFGNGGKLGTKGNPMYTISGEKGAASGAASMAAGLMSKNGGVSGFLGGMLKSFLPFLATGGPIAGPAIVGEQGPELFIPSSSGSIIPNHKLTATSGSGGDTYYSINAQGTDPVQTEQRVRSAIVAAHQSAVAQAVKQVSQNASRTPAGR